MMFILLFVCAVYASQKHTTINLDSGPQRWLLAHNDTPLVVTVKVDQRLSLTQDLVGVHIAPVNLGAPAWSSFAIKVCQLGGKNCVHPGSDYV